MINMHASTHAARLCGVKEGFKDVTESRSNSNIKMQILEPEGK